jgi:putative CocE/NonD family hydrolase
LIQVKKEWKTYDSWPPKNTLKKTMYLSNNQELTTEKRDEEALNFISDIKRPVPYSEDIKTVFTPRKYMTDDQRFAARRPDVLVFETDLLTEDLTLSGDILAKLKVATTGTAADWIVKIIDVHPADTKNNINNKKFQNHLKMSNYHLMVRSEVMRGRFRNSFEKPEPFLANKKTSVNIKLQDVFHTVKKGHKLQIQIQSTWFPLIDLNPQTYVDNIYKAEEKDFKTQTHTIFTDSTIEFTILNK